MLPYYIVGADAVISLSWCVCVCMCVCVSPWSETWHSSSPRCCIAGCWFWDQKVSRARAWVRV